MNDIKKITLKIEDNDEGKRLDSFLAHRKVVPSRSFAQNLISQGFVKIGGKPTTKNYRLKKGETVFVEIPHPKPSTVTPENIPLNIIYEDEDLIVLSKPVGLVVHPSRGHVSGTLVNALLAHTKDLSGVGGVIRPGIVHRLDKNTSGLMIVAKNDRAHHVLSRALKDREIKRLYLALVHGVMEVEAGVIDAPIGRNLKTRKTMTVTERGSKRALTTFKVKERLGNYTLLQLKLETGRTHQIRVHMRYIKHPVVGDPDYGYKKIEKNLGLTRQFLHSYRLEFVHPRTGKELSFEDELPEELMEVLKHLRACQT